MASKGNSRIRMRSNNRRISQRIVQRKVMSKYIDTEKLKDEIKHLKIDVYDEAHQFDLGARSSLTFLESFIDTLTEK
jgi:hypothetical protein